MNIVTSLLVALVLVINLAFAQPSLADKPKFLKNPDYIEVTKALNDWKAVKEAQVQTENYNPEEIQKKIDELEFQKYALETGVNWGQCRNETGKTLAVYGPKPKFDDDDFDYPYDNALYFLANGQATEEKWDCQGVYLPSGFKTAAISPDGQVQELVDPVAARIGDGTQLVMKTNPVTGAVEFNVVPGKIFKAGEANWFIPNVSQALIDTRIPNAPTAKSEGNNIVVLRTLAKQTDESKVSQPQTEEQHQSQPQAQPSLLRGNSTNRR